MKLRVDFQAPKSVTVDLTEAQEKRWREYEAAGEALDQTDWFTNREEYDRLSEAYDGAWDALVFSLDLYVEDAEDLVDDISPTRW